jgi:hypothetical protein
VIDDVDACMTMDLKQEGSELFLIGESYEELGGSEYCRKLGICSGRVPGVDFPPSDPATTGQVMKLVVTAPGPGSLPDTSTPPASLALPPSSLGSSSARPKSAGPFRSSLLRV